MSSTLASFAAAASLGLAPDVVELTDGTRFVGEILSRRDGIEMITPLGRRRFEAGDVARTELRAELTRRYHAARAGAGEQPHALASLVTWCLDHGLYAEAFDGADRLLDAAPQDPLARDCGERILAEALLDGANASEWPDAVVRERLLRRIGGSSATRDRFARALLLRGAREELLAWLLSECSDPDSDVRRGACELLAEVPSDAGLSRVIKLSLMDPAEKVRAAALDAALRSGHPELAIPYLRAIETGDVLMCERACPALARIRDPRSVPALIELMAPKPAAAGGSGGARPRAHVFFGEQISYVRDFDVEIAQGAVIAKPVIGVLQAGTVLDVGVGGVTVISHRVRNAALGALRRLSGLDFGSSPAKWAGWWAGQGGALPEVAVAERT